MDLEDMLYPWKTKDPPDWAIERYNLDHNIKDNFETWKVTAVEEVARMKLRGRIENIDKAGLKDVLGR